MKEKLLAPLLAAVSTIALLALPRATLGEEQNLQNLAKAACVAYQANISSLKTYKCRFTYTRASATSVEKALAGEYADVRECDFLLVTDGEREKYQTTTDIEIPQAAKAKMDRNQGRRLGGRDLLGQTVEFNRIADLRSGTAGMYYFAPWKQLTLTGSTPPRGRTLETPLSILGWEHAYGPVQLLERVSAGKAEITSAAQSVYEGQAVVSAKFASPFWGEMEFLFDAARGYLPLRTNDRRHDPKGKRFPETQIHLREAKNVGKSRWFPMHAVRVTLEPAGNVVTVLDIRVTELVMDKVTEEDMTLEIPAGTGVTWVDVDKDGLAHFRLRQNEKLTPKDIPRVERMLKSSTVEPMMDTAVKTYRKPRGAGWYLISGFALLFCVSLVAYRRFRVVKQ